MSQTHFAVVSEAFGAVKTADQAAVERLFDPAVEWHNTSAFPGERVWKGPRAVIAFWQTLTEDFQEGGSHEIEEYAESHDRAVVGFHSWGSGRASGVPVDVRWAAIFELRDQRVARVDVYGSYARASQAVELRA
jgi:ketosteroid isomerase-like protein